MGDELTPFDWRRTKRPGNRRSDSAAGSGRWPPQPPIHGPECALCAAEAAAPPHCGTGRVPRESPALPPRPSPPLLQAGFPPSFPARPPVPLQPAPQRVGEGARVRTRGPQPHSSTFRRAAPAPGWSGRARALPWRQRARVAGRGWSGRCEGSGSVRPWQAERDAEGSGDPKGSGVLAAVRRLWGLQDLGCHKDSESCEGSVRA